MYILEKGGHMKTMNGSDNLSHRLMILMLAAFCGVIFLMTSCTGGDSPPVQELTTEQVTVQPATITPTITATPAVMPTQNIIAQPVIADESIQFSKEQCPASIEEYTQYIKDNPGSAEAYYMRGCAYFNLGDFKSAF
jgi:hypothetical protein